MKNIVFLAVLLFSFNVFAATSEKVKLEQNLKESPQESDLKWYKNKPNEIDGFDSLFNDEIFNHPFGYRYSFYSDITKVNVSEDDTNYYYNFAIPGFEKNQISLSTQGSNLVMQAKSENKKEDENQQFQRKEFYAGSVKKVILLSDDADTQNISASYKNGILEVIVGKLKSPAKKATIIEIK